MKLTDGYGVDVILNSLVGELLEASWNLVARGGTLIELGKKDVGDHGRLSMAPFIRSASFRALHLPDIGKTWELVPRYAILVPFLKLLVP